MKEQELTKNIAGIRRELDDFLAAGDRESIMKSIVFLNNTWELVFRKDDGIRHTYLLQKIWVDEMARNEPSIFADIHSVFDVLTKCRLLRHAIYRLENDFPLDLCLEAIQTISAMNLSNTAFQEISKRWAEDGDKVLARINEISDTYT